MTYDYYHSLRDQKSCPDSASATGLASGLVDAGTVWSYKEKHPGTKESDPRNDARRCYMEKATKLNGRKVDKVGYIADPDFSTLPESSWFGIKIEFTLKTPWYSKDDRPLHVMDNPVRKDRLFGVSFMSASSWKGMLRWACRMQKEMTKKEEIHLFGNDKDEQKDFSAGALVFYPTWFDNVGFEMINPHSRKTKAGTNPIYYEVVSPETKGMLSLLYAPFPGSVDRDNGASAKVFLNLVDAIEALLQTYGISAKRTVGWGTAQINGLEGFKKTDKTPLRNEYSPKKKVLKGLQSLGELTDTSDGKPAFSAKNVYDFKMQIQTHFSGKGGTA